MMSRVAEVAALLASIIVVIGVVLIFLAPQATTMIAWLIGVGFVLGFVVYVLDPHAFESEVTRVCTVIVIFGVIITIIYVLYVAYFH